MNAFENSACYALISVIFLILLYRFGFSKKRVKLPPGPFNLPIVGYLPFLREKPLEKLTALKEKYGGIFRLHLGSSPVVVIADFETLKEAFSKSETLDRPQDLFHGMPDRLGLTSTNGSEWLEQRKYTTKIMRELGIGKSEWHYLVQDQVDAFIENLKKQNGEPFDATSSLIPTLANSMFSLAFGYQLPLNHQKMTTMVNAVHSFPKLYTQTGILCLIPGVSELLKKIGCDFTASEMKHMMALNRFVRDEIILKRKELNENATEDSFMSGYLQKMKENYLKGGSFFNEQNLAGNVQSIVLGGTGTSLYTLLWLFIAMAANARVQEKVHEEIDNVLGRSRKAQWTDRLTLPYTYATILESLRWRPVGPLGIQRRTSEHTKIGGYDIPKDTIIIPFLWAVHHDTNIWKNPEDFIPERFIDDNGDLVSKQDGWVPFSYGKRNCPGLKPALIEIFLYFTTVMQKFTILNYDVEKSVDVKYHVNLDVIPNQRKLKFKLRV